MIDAGFILALLASIVALYGVWLFNQKKDYTGARAVWTFSNIAFTVYFVGRVLVWWDGLLGDGAMLVYFLCMTISNIYGLMKS